MQRLRDLVAVEDLARPLQHACDVVPAQKALGLHIEPAIRDSVESAGAVEFITTWTYTLAHTTGFVAMFLWIRFFRRENFAVFRN